MTLPETGKEAGRGRRGGEGGGGQRRELLRAELAARGGYHRRSSSALGAAPARWCEVVRGTRRYGEGGSKEGWDGVWQRAGGCGIGGREGESRYFRVVWVHES